MSLRNPAGRWPSNSWSSKTNLPSPKVQGSPLKVFGSGNRSWPKSPASSAILLWSLWSALERIRVNIIITSQGLTTLLTLAMMFSLEGTTRKRFFPSKKLWPPADPASPPWAWAADVQWGGWKMRKVCLFLKIKLGAPTPTCAAGPPATRRRQSQPAPEYPAFPFLDIVNWVFTEFIIFIVPNSGKLYPTNAQDCASRMFQTEPPATGRFLNRSLKSSIGPWYEKCPDTYSGYRPTTFRVNRLTSGPPFCPLVFFRCFFIFFEKGNEQRHQWTGNQFWIGHVPW